MTKRRAVRFALGLMVAAAIDVAAFWWHFLRDVPRRGSGFEPLRHPSQSA